LINEIKRHMTEKPWLFKSTWRALVALLFLGLTLPGIAKSSNESQRAVPAATKQKLGKVQIPFIANQGQIDKEVKFYARTFAGTVFVKETGELVYSFPKLEDKKRVNRAALKEELIGGKVTEVKGESQAVTKLNYFKGNDRSTWHTNIPSYDSVNLGEVYQGIDVKLKAHGNNVEKLFYVKPGAKPETIKIKLCGAKEIRVAENGELEVETEQGTVRFSKPVAFQEVGAKEFVEAAYVVRGNEYGFKVKDYNRTKELVIDPILAATFVGGSGTDFINALALDSAGNVYVAGETNSIDFPGIGPGSADGTLSPVLPDGAVSDGFVAKLNSDLSSILAATFLGGSSSNSTAVPLDQALALALDSTGNVYVAGVTNSADFPGIGPSSADSTIAGNEGFVAKLNSDLSSILAATFLGGSDADRADALALDNTGNVYVAGGTDSSDFPGIGPGSADGTFVGGQRIHSGRSEGFVAKLSSDLSSILAATFMGGSDEDRATVLALDSTGIIYVAGETEAIDFPGVGPGSADSTLAGPTEGFVAKLDRDLRSILKATFLGGSSNLDLPFAIALDNRGDVYVAGFTASSDFPGIDAGSADSTFAGPDEGFVAKLNSDLSSILAATFLGGSGTESAGVLALDNTGNVYVAGNTDSLDFPGIGPGSADSNARSGEGFVAKLDANLSRGQQIINDQVTFVVQSTSFSPTAAPGGPAGTFTVTAVLTNTSTENILEPINAIVSTLTNGNKLLSATEGDGGVSSKQAINAGADAMLIPNDSATVQFKIGLANRSPFSFFVDVWGIVSGDD
jgi:Beta-propeller repeat